jgi:peptidyl-prolyl cis-trans isomerase C
MMRKSTRWIPAILAALVLCIFLSPVGAAEKAAKKDAKPAAGPSDTAAKATAPKDAAKNDKVAVVNGTVITRGEYETETKRFERQMAMSGQAPQPGQVDEMKKKVLDGLVGREVLKQQAAKLGIKADPAEVDKQVAALKQKFPSEDEFKNALKNLNLTEDALKAQFAQDLGIRKMIDEQVASKITITPEETKKFYDSNPDLFKTPEMVRASHILIKVDPKATPEDKAKAKEKIAAAQKRVQGGEDFAKVAKEVSECPSKENGGDLDFFQRGQMVGPFEEAAFALKVGSISDIVETQFGFHVIKVTEKKDAGVMKYDEIKDRIAEHLKQNQVNEQLTKYIDDLKSKAKIETFAVN